MHWQSCNKIIFTAFSIIIFMGYPNFLYSQSKPITDWEFLSTSTIGARQFITAHPEYDGRGIVIFILDSGVDMGVSGLITTSDGNVKVIDARDFSGQGDVSLYSAKIGEEDQEKYLEHPDGFRLYNYQRLHKAPPDDSYLIGYLDEKRFANSDVKDINNNGRFDDRFGVLTFEVSDGDSLYWIAYVDTDGDQQIDDENAIRDYNVHFNTFQLRGGEKHFDRQLLTFTLNIIPEEMIVSLHFDDNGHGTHVAGIAAGYKINDEMGFNGIAPGAQIISLKIGNGTYEGGCTVTGSLKKALEFAEDYARTHRQPIVINISYGVGSIREGSSDIDFIVNSLLTINDNIFVCVSNGNDGPGISTTGAPAAAPSVFSVGALLPADMANKYYGANLKTDKIFYFSACGGELNKPDAVAPGSASSTVPQFMDDDFMRGTSMAAPQASGAAALLLSAAIQSEPKLPIKNILIHRALKFSAHPISGYNYLEQGSGVINVPDAFQLLQSYSKKYQRDSVVEYEITTESPALSDGSGSAAYWRTGGYFPQKSEQQTFTIRPVFNDTIEANAQAKFYRAFDLTASHP
ncbi:S8 family serine peptidase, partial [candidate division KSB1 bacterium]|nr:S8 family serine peptidase [candidate division KSB1 bacterium]